MCIRDSPKGVRVAKDRNDNKWKVSVDLGEKGQTSRHDISFDEWRQHRSCGVYQCRMAVELSIFIIERTVVEIMKAQGAADKGTISKNKAANLKSSLSRHVNKLNAA